MKNIPITRQNITNSSSTLISTLYNSIKPPRIPKCFACNNEEPERQLQRKEGTNYFFIPDRHVDVFVCAFCKKLDEPKCTFCWDSKPCCTHREKTNIDDFFKTVKQDIIKTAHSIVETYKGYEKRSTEELFFSMGQNISTESIKKELTIHFYQVQDQFRKDVEEQMAKNYQKVFDVYQAFETDLKVRLSSGNNEALERIKKDQNKNISLQDCLKWLNELENRREQISKMGNDVCDGYVEKMSVDYPKVLFNKLMEAFRTVLLPKVTFKDSMIQTVSENIGSLHSIGSEKNIREKREENAGPSMVDEKVEKLQNVIKKDIETMNRLEERVKELEFILSIEQEKNQEMEMRIIELEAQCGISNERDISMIEGPLNMNGQSRMNQNKSFDVKNSLRTSRSNPDFLNQTEIVTAEERRLENEKVESPKNEVEEETKNIKNRKKSTTEKKGAKMMMENSTWLEEVVNEIKE